MHHARPGRRRPRQDDAGAEIPRRADDVDARLDLHPDDRRRLSGGRRALPVRPRRPRHPARAGLLDAVGGAVGGGPDRAGDPRRLSRRRPAGGDRAAPGAAPHRRSSTRTAAGSRWWRRRSSSTWSQPNTDPDYPLEPPTGRSGRPESARQSYSIAGGQRVRRPVRRHLPFLRSAGPRDRHADPRGGRGADGDQPAPRRPARARRPGVPCSSARSARRRCATTCTRPSWPSRCRAEPGSAMHIHQSVIDIKTGRQHLLRRRRRPDAGVLRLHRRLAELPAGGDLHDGALRELLPAADPLGVGAGQHDVGLRQPHRRPSACRPRRRRRGASRTASRPPTPIPISRSPPRSPAAISA